jgi:hypothetical protein
MPNRRRTCRYCRIFATDSPPPEVRQHSKLEQIDGVWRRSV